MRIDVVTIFPDYLAPLELSLPGKAQAKGLLSLHVHDLRQWTHDRHHTVDDTPYGGGAGMVMKPEPWGEALDAVLEQAGAPLDKLPDRDEAPVLVVPSPSGARFDQATARELSTRAHLVFACGRYEGIDQRVLDDAAERFEVRELSLGDYVLNGGEVATLAMVEAIARLIPGFMGNAASLLEESHEGGLLEYPVYTKPATWRGRDVPDVLLSGDHGRIAGWRREQSVRRTAERRPDLLNPGSVMTDLDRDVQIGPAVPADAGELLTLQRACWVQEWWDNPDADIPALRESLEQLRAWLVSDTVLVARVRDSTTSRLVGAVRAHLDADGNWDIGRLMVVPDLQGRGLGRALLERIEAAAPDSVGQFTLFTGVRSTANLRRYKRAGYRLAGEIGGGAVRLTKRR